MKTKILFLIINVIVLSQCENIDENEKSSLITGKVIERDSKVLILKKATEDARYQGVEVMISNEGTFQHQLDAPFIEEYELVFKEEHQKGKWRPIRFYPDNDTIKFELYSMDKADQNVITGGKLSSKITEFEGELKKTFEKTIEYWYAKQDSVQNEEHVHADYLKLVSGKIDSIHTQIMVWKLDYFEKDLSIFSYAAFLKILRQASNLGMSPATFERCFGLFSKKFPDHPYTSISKNLLKGLNQIKVGGSYIDFTAQDNAGELVTLSDQVSKNKLILIDLWAPWCGPCIRKSKKIVPLYNELNALGFDVVAVMGGISDQSDFTNALEKHNYPWTTLMEVNDQNKIWEKYNISNSGGSQFLVDNSGKILAINPDPEEIVKLLQQL